MTELGLKLTVSNNAPKITAANKPDVNLAASAAVTLLLDFHAKTSRPVFAVFKGPQRGLAGLAAPRTDSAGQEQESDRIV